MSRIVKRDDENMGVEVNIMYIFTIILRRLWLVVLAGLVAAAACATVTKAFKSPEYTVAMSFIVNNRSEKDLASSDNSVSYNDMSASAYMANTFVHLMTSRTMCHAIADRCEEYPKSADSVEQMINATRKTDSSIIDMTVTAASPQEAYEVAQAVTSTYKDVAEVYSGGSIHLCDAPEIPVEPDLSVDIIRNAVIGALVGVVLAAAAVILAESLRNTVRSQDDIQDKLDLTVIGEVAQVGGKKRRKSKGKKTRRELLITDKRCDFAFIETYKTIRTKVELLSARKGYKSFVISSAGANEGKTTVAVNFALALAQNGYSVLLVDGDLRKPSVLRTLELGSVTGNGVADIVYGGKDSADVIKYVEKYKIYILAGSKSVQDPTEVLSNAKTGELFEKARSEFDFIIVDTPPIGIVADAAVCSKYCDATIFVVRENTIAIPRISEAVENISAGGKEIAGCIYNNTLNPMRVGYGRYSRYGRKYGGYYSKQSYGGYDQLAKNSAPGRKK